ncbi:hypothetical protein VTJ04DRAFT_253 [Mycothermus thermophilus]|uniref:uncharacterized protein n=1 Tax=Humicola insolens TaxID=85995 RepID=UPI003742605B
MRLINVHTFELEEFIGNSIPFHEYAILSHTWGDHELLFTDMTDLERVRLTKPVGFAKLEGSCALAKRQGLKYVWIDTCCIDKSSSAELSEAINSMYMWYQKSRICYAYLSDVSTLDGSGHQQSEVLEQVGRSRWFTRGWTLQELLAPKRVEFYTANWDYIGKKDDDKLLTILSQASLVDECVLANIVSLDKISVAKKMYWASRRETTRTEDIAYCLLDLRRDDYIKSQQQQIDLSGGLLTLGATVQRAKVSGERCYVIRVGLIFRKDEQWHDDQAMLGM